MKNPKSPIELKHVVTICWIFDWKERKFISKNCKEKKCKLKSTEFKKQEKKSNKRIP